MCPDRSGREGVLLIISGLDGSPVLFGLGLLALLALDVRTHVVIPVLRAYGRRWATRIAASPAPTRSPPATSQTPAFG